MVKFLPSINERREKMKKQQKKHEKPENPFLGVFCLWKIHTKFSFHSANDFTWRRAIFHFQKIFWIFYFAPSSKADGGELLLWQKQIFSFIVNRERVSAIVSQSENVRT